MFKVMLIASAAGLVHESVSDCTDSFLDMGFYSVEGMKFRNF